MCGRYAIAYSSEELPSHFKSQHLPVSARFGKGEHHDRSYNVAPTADGAVYRAKDHELRYMKWGLIPHWTKSVKDFKTYKTFNARAENLQDSRMWTQCCNSKRCVIPLSGYYEWKVKGKKKVPYYVIRNDGKLGFVAGMYDYLESEDLWTYTIITAKAPKELAWLHDRMPVLLEPGSEAWETWMNPDKTDWTQEELDHLLAAHYDDKMLSVYQVSEDVNKVGNSSESMVKPIYKEDSGKFNVERFSEEKEHESDVKEEPPTKRFKAEPKDEERTQRTLTKNLSGKAGIKKEQRGKMVEGDQEEDLEIEDTSLANDDAGEIEDAFVRDDEDADLEEEYLKQSEDEEVEEGDLENVGEDDDEYLEGGEENEEYAEGSDYTEEVKTGEMEGTAGQSIGERVKNEDMERAEEPEITNADVSQEQHSKKRRTSGVKGKGDTGEESSKWGTMTASEAGKKGGRKSSRSSGAGDASEQSSDDEEAGTTSGHKGPGNRGKGDTGKHSERWGSMTASQAGKKGGRKGSRSSGAKGDNEHSSKDEKMSASEAGKKGGRRSSRGKDTGEGSSWGEMSATEAGRKGGRVKKQNT